MALKTLLSLKIFRNTKKISCKIVNLNVLTRENLFLTNISRIISSDIKVPANSSQNNKKETSITTPLSSIFPKPDPQQQEKQQKEDEEEARKTREASWRTMKWTLTAFGVSFTLLGGWLIVELGAPPKDENGRIMEDDYSPLPIVQQYCYRVLKELDYYNRMIKEPSREKLLPDPATYPYFQPPYTLVLELTDVLVHPDWTYKTGWRFKKRPGIDHFLQQLGPPLFEIVVFTAETGMTVFPIIEALDPNQIISYKLVRDATHFEDGHHIKNLSKLNRDLNKVIVVDWNSESVKFHPENILKLPRWKGNDDDTTLIDLTAFLKTIATSSVDDVREVLRYYSQFDDPLAAFRENQRRLLEQQEAEREAQAAQPKPLTKSWSPNFLRR